MLTFSRRTGDKIIALLQFITEAIYTNIRKETQNSPRNTIKMMSQIGFLIFLKIWKVAVKDGSILNQLRG